jgi:hypothetical protein
VELPMEVEKMELEVVTELREFVGVKKLKCVGIRIINLNDIHKKCLIQKHKTNKLWISGCDFYSRYTP